MKSIFTLLVSSIIAFLIGEVVFRIYTPVELPLLGLSVPDSLIGYRMNPEFEGRQRSPDYNVYIRTNSKGLRGGEYPPLKEYTRTILILGDSFTFGHGVSEDKTFSARLQELLNSEYSDTFFVINAGVMGYDNIQQMRYLKSEGLNFNPWMVIMAIYPENDLKDNLQDERSRATNLQQRDIEDNFILKHSRFIWVLKSAYINLRLKSIYSGKKNPEAVKRTHFIYLPSEKHRLEPLTAEMDSIIAEFYALGKEKNFYPLVMLIPARLQLRKADQEIAIAKLPNYEWDFDRPTKITTEIISKYSKDLLDLYEIFSKHPSLEGLYFKHDKHFSVEGHELAAEQLFNTIKEYINITKVDSADMKTED